MNSKFIFHHYNIANLLLIEQKKYQDQRGEFTRLFCAEELSAIGWNKPIRQINHTVTHKKGTIRGLHFQYPPESEMKILQCLNGEIHDVVVDLRLGSPTFLTVHTQILTGADNFSLLIPAGFAHGYQSLSDDTSLLYLHSADYLPSAEGGINPFDESLAIKWPLDCSEISLRDQNLPRLERNFTGLIV